MAGPLLQRGRQRMQRGDSLVLGPRLQPFAQHHQRDDDGRSFEIQVAHGVTAVREKLVDAQAECGRGAEGDQQVHVAGTRLDCAPTGSVKARAQPELHGSRQSELQPSVQHPVAAEEQAEHRQRQWQRQRRRDGDRPPCGASGRRSSRGRRLARRVAGGLHRGDERLGRGRRLELHFCTLGGQVDFG